MFDLFNWIEVFLTNLNFLSFSGYLIGWIELLILLFLKSRQGILVIQRPIERVGLSLFAIIIDCRKHKLIIGQMSSFSIHEEIVAIMVAIATQNMFDIE